MFEIEAPGFISLKIGTGPSRARYRLRDPATFRRFLRDAVLEAAGVEESASLQALSS
jgi:hypothetical protein